LPPLEAQCVPSGLDHEIDESVRETVQLWCSARAAELGSDYGIALGLRFCRRMAKDEWR